MRAKLLELICDYNKMQTTRIIYWQQASLVVQWAKNPTAMWETAFNAGDPSLIPGSGRSPGEGIGNPLQYTCLGNPMGRGTWQGTAHGSQESDTQQLNHLQTQQLNHHYHTSNKQVEFEILKKDNIVYISISQIEILRYKSYEICMRFTHK